MQFTDAPPTAVAERRATRPRRPPQARDRMLGFHLRQHRRERGLSLETAAREARLSLATMSRIETGKRHITPEDVAALLAVYRIDPHRRAELVAAARGGHRPAWWAERAPGRTPDVLAVCVASAYAVTEWATSCVPSALQTRRYGLGHLRACGVDDLDAAWADRVEAQRSRTLVDQTYFLHQAALLPRYGGRGAIREQLDHLRGTSDLGIGLRIVRSGVPLGSLAHGWTRLEFTDSVPMVYVELQGGGLFLHEPTIAEYHAALAELQRTACTVDETRTLLAAMANSL